MSTRPARLPLCRSQPAELYMMAWVDLLINIHSSAFPIEAQYHSSIHEPPGWNLTPRLSSGEQEESKLILNSSGQWLAQDGHVKQFWPMRLKRKSAGRLQEKIFLLPETAWKKMSLSSYTKNDHLWLWCLNCSSHFGALRGVHVGAKHSVEGGRAEREPGVQDPPGAVTASWLKLSPTLVMCTIHSSHCFTLCQSGFCYLLPKSYFTDIKYKYP